MKLCNKCGIKKPLQLFYKRKDRNGYVSECRQCFKKRMGDRHQRHKDALVNEFGGECIRCGYNKCSRILDFHHLDPTSKSFEISDKLSSNLDILRKEASKCVLLCPNCHREKHHGMW